MSKRVKSTGVMLSLVLVLMLVLSACGNNSNKGAEGSATTPPSTNTETAAPDSETAEHVKLKMYFLGDKSKDVDLVFAEINKKLTEKINAELEPVFLSWADWEQKYPLLFASGENFDMIYTANWAKYAETAAKGGFLEITEELRNKYLPLTMANLPDAAWPGTMINGKNYMIPQNNTFANHYGIAIRGDLREKYGLPVVKTIEDLEVYMDAVVKNEPGMIPMDTSVDGSEQLLRALVVYNDEYQYLTGLGLSTLAYKITDRAVLDIKPITELPSYEGFVNRMVEWNASGYFSKSDFTSSDPKRYEAGKSAVKVDNIDNINRLYQVAKKDHPDWKVEYVNILEGKALGNAGFAGNGVGINAASKNPERALMATDLLEYDPELNFLINYGIPDVHAKLVKTEEVDGKPVQYIENITDTYGGFSTWAFTNINTMPLDAFEGYTDIANNYKFKQITYHPLDGFTMATDNVKTEIATIATTIKEYMPQLNFGISKDASKKVEEFNSKLKAAGGDKINAEAIAQATAIFNAAQ